MENNNLKYSVSQNDCYSQFTLSRKGYINFFFDTGCVVSIFFSPLFLFTKLLLLCLFLCLGHELNPVFQEPSVCSHKNHTINLTRKFVKKMIHIVSFSFYAKCIFVWHPKNKDKKNLSKFTWPLSSVSVCFYMEFTIGNMI